MCVHALYSCDVIVIAGVYRQLNLTNLFSKRFLIVTYLQKSYGGYLGFKVRTVREKERKRDKER